MRYTAPFTAKAKLLRKVIFILVAWAMLTLSLALTAPAQTYRNFEGPQVHPLALTPDGTRLLALNTPNNQLLVFHLTGSTTTLLAEIPVGLEPVSIALRSNNEAWVVNWLGDSVSVVDLTKMRVVRSFDVGDEPTDVIFAGGATEKAFVCVSGFNQVKVYDPNNANAAPQTIAIRGKKPRSLARAADGSQVFVSVFESGNNTTVVPQTIVSANGGLPPPNPARAPGLPPNPPTGLIVKWNGTSWLDERGTFNWNPFISYSLADVDVVALQANTPGVTTAQEIRHVGTLIGNAAYDAPRQRLLVANIEATNEVRFEPNLDGKFNRTRVAAVNLNSGSATFTNWDANPHINYSGAGSDAERAQSLALPADLQVATDGTVYMAGNGSGRVGVFNAAGSVVARINVGGGPTGLAIDEPRQRLYVLNRFDETLSVVNTATRTELRRVQLGFNPEPDTVRVGRRFLYDANFSAHGDVSCASCHSNGEVDGLAWDLGNPLGTLTPITIVGGPQANLHPMKGAMTTQSFRGILGTEPFHWRGDKATLSDFNPAFTDLQGSPRALTTAEMTQFTEFVRTLTYTPNPYQNLDRTLPNPATGPSAVRGRQIFTTVPVLAGGLRCNGCHTLNTGTGTNGGIHPAGVIGQSQPFKGPQLRGVYKKTGFVRTATGEQITGFGATHDGADGGVFEYLKRPIFTLTDDQRNDLVEFVKTFDTGLAPAVGLQVTVNANNQGLQATIDRVNLLVAQANANNCNLIVKGFYQNRQRGFAYIGSNNFRPDRVSEANVGLTQLLASVSAGQELTFIGVPPGDGTRLGIDYDGNGTLNGDEAQTNAIDNTGFFVQQQYLDFLGREPDQAGLDYWTGQITACGTDAACIHRRRLDVSAAFFVELEFQETGSFVYRFYKSSLGRLPSYAEFLPDRALVVGGSNLEQNKQAFALNWVQRAAFLTKYPATQTGAQFVDALIANVLQASGVNLVAMRDSLLSEYNAQANQTAARARVVRLVSDAGAFQTAEYNKAFVLMQYFGYLRRDIDQGGYDFWLDVVTNRQPGNYRGMVCAFATSAEYQYRFGTILTRSNADCNGL